MLSENLKKARKISGYSQDEVAARLKITRQSISKWENGHAYPDVISLKLLSDLYNISIDEIVKDDEVIWKKEAFENNTKEHKHKENWNNETMFMLVLTIVSCLIPSLGIVVSLFFVIQLLRKKRECPVIIKLIIVFCLMISLINFCVILNNQFFHIGEATIV